MIGELLLFPLVAPLKGALWVIEQINNRVFAELNDPETLKKELMQLQISFERDVIDEDEYFKQAALVWKKLSGLNQLDTGGDPDTVATYPEQ
ncbi:MAG TPA: gas vesicle protein GvpG [Bacillota bacterium]|nr:gas vesicle protein GvpG [Bacillota bacterium]